MKKEIRKIVIGKKKIIKINGGSKDRGKGNTRINLASCIVLLRCFLSVSGLKVRGKTRNDGG
jgi:hypothetical protein